MESFLSKGDSSHYWYFTEALGGQTLSPIRRDYEKNPEVGDGLSNIIVKKDYDLMLFKPHYFSWLAPTNEMPIKEIEGNIEGFELKDTGTIFRRIGGRLDKKIYTYWPFPSRYTNVIDTSVAYIVHPNRGVYGWLPNTILMPTMAGMTDGDNLDVVNECLPCECKYKPCELPFSIEIFEASSDGCIVQTSIPIVHITEDPLNFNLLTSSYEKVVNFSDGTGPYHPHHPIKNSYFRNPISVKINYDPVNLFTITLRNYFGGYSNGKLRLLGVRLLLNGSYRYPYQIIQAMGVNNPNQILNGWNVGDIVCDKYDESMLLTELTSVHSDLGLKFQITLNELINSDIPIVYPKAYPYNKIIIRPKDCSESISGKVRYKYRLVSACYSPLTFTTQDDPSTRDDPNTTDKIENDESLMFPPASQFRPAGVGIRGEDKKCPVLTLSERNEVYTSKP